MRKPLRIAVSAPRARVFELLVEPSWQVRWMEGLAEAKYDRAVARGVRFRHAIREAGGRLAVLEGEVRQYTAPIHFAYQVDHPQFRIEIDYLLTDETYRTLVDYRCLYVPKNFVARLFSYCFSWMPSRLARKHLARLKTLAETP